MAIWEGGKWNEPEKNPGSKTTTKPNSLMTQGRNRPLVTLVEGARSRHYALFNFSIGSRAFWSLNKLNRIPDKLYISDSLIHKGNRMLFIERKKIDASKIYSYLFAKVLSLQYSVPVLSEMI